MYRRCSLMIAAAILAAATILSACAPAATPAVVPSPLPQATIAASPTPEPVTTPAALLTLKIVTYNILVGAGKDPELAVNAPAKYQGVDRLSMLLDFLKKLDADVVGLQEASGWEKGEPPYIETVADQMGMKSVISADRGWGSDVALLTKLDVIESEDLSDDINSILRAKLKGPDGEPVNVFVVHLSVDSQENRSCGTQFLLRTMQPYANQRTFLIGDLNVDNRDPTEWTPTGLREGGWQTVALDNRLGFDQIWAPASLKWDATVWSTAISDDIVRISDHAPLGRELNIYSPSGDLVPNDAAPTPMPELVGLPEQVRAEIGSARVAFAQQPDAPCNEQRWMDYGLNAEYQAANLHLYGKKDWGAGANWLKRISEGQGMLLDFKYEAKSELILSLEAGTPGGADFRKFGLYIGEDGKFRSDLWAGNTSLGTDVWIGSAEAKPDTWYRLLLVPRKDGAAAGYVWAVDDPANVSRLTRDADPKWAALSWRLMTGANRGTIDIRNVTQLVLEGGQ